MKRLYSPLTLALALIPITLVYGQPPKIAATVVSDIPESIETRQILDAIRTIAVRQPEGDWERLMTDRARGSIEQILAIEPKELIGVRTVEQGGADVMVSGWIVKASAPVSRLWIWDALNTIGLFSNSPRATATGLRRSSKTYSLNR
jgi:hypothetical protein